MRFDVAFGVIFDRAADPARDVRFGLKTAAHPGLEMSRPDGACYCILKCPRRADEAGVTPTRRELVHKSWSLRSSKEHREENESFVHANG
jgi:hypothetical protein